MGAGSQRAAIEDPDLIDTYSVTRNVAPNILLFANLGAVQLNYGYDIDTCRRAVDMLEADALILHLNPLQEALQAGGNVDFSGLAKKIEKVCHGLNVPVIVKEVGWGISKRTAKLLADCGVAVIDVAGAGGTSWSQVEMYRAPDELKRDLAATFQSWGISTVDSILNVKQAAPGVIIFASGGLKNGLDIAKTLLLGASLGGMANQVLKPASVSAKRLDEMLNLTIQQIKVTLFTSGLKNIRALHTTKYY
jgi:isopentenyl-diphosphate delta-isomerase